MISDKISRWVPLFFLRLASLWRLSSLLTRMLDLTLSISNREVLVKFALVIMFLDHHSGFS